MHNTLYAALLVAVVALCTALTRFLPFLVFDGKRPVPPVIRYLGAVLPCAVMAMLVVYCLKDISFGSLLGWLPYAVSVAVVAILHICKRNTLLSIVVGTVCYMVLIRFL